MTNIINLRQKRKAKAKAEKEQQAQANRTHHGLTKAQKSLAAKKNKLERDRLDGKSTQNTDE